MGVALERTAGLRRRRLVMTVMGGRTWLAMLVLIAMVFVACGSEKPGESSRAGAPTPTSAATSPTITPGSTPRTSGAAVRGSSQHQDRDGYKFLISVDLNIKGASINTTNSKPGFAKVFYDATASVGYKNVTGGGRSASLNSQFQMLRVMWELSSLKGAAADHCAKAPFVIKGMSYCIFGDIKFRPNPTNDAEFRRRVADGETSSYVYPTKYREPERAASMDIPEDAARALVDMFNRGEGPTHIGMTSDQKQLQPICLIGKDLDVAAIQNVWWMFLVDKAGRVNNTIC